MAETPPRSVAIVGCGASGLLVAVQLMRQAQGPLEIRLYGRDPFPGRGVAYGTTWPGHLLNVPAGNMSALPDDPAHLLRWLTAPRADGAAPLPTATERTFTPRPLYGSYLADLLREAEAAAPRGVRLNRRVARVDRLLRAPSGGGRWRIQSDDDEVFDADAVVLAVGVPPPAPLPGARHFGPTLRHTPDPWRVGALERLPRAGPLLVVGSGLTMVDVVLWLAAHSHRGPFHALSRHGRLPRWHRFAPAWSDAREVALASPPNVLAALRALRREAESAGVDAEQTVDGLRAVTPLLWRRLPPAEQRRFIRHLRPHWDRLRHRVAREIGDRVEQLLREGRLHLHAGRMIGADAVDDQVEVRWRARGSERIESLRVVHVVNCTGLDPDLNRTADPLVHGLLLSGVIAPGAGGVGFATNDDGELLDPSGRPASGLFTLGPPRRGDLFESIAMPEVRVQAAQVAARIVEAGWARG